MSPDRYDRFARLLRAGAVDLERQGLVLATAGTAIGVLAALLATRVLGSLLYDVTPTDVRTYVSIVGLIVAAALIASWIPARRATRIHPMEALRTE